MLIDSLRTAHVLISTYQAASPPQTALIPNQTHSNVWIAAEHHQSINADAIFTHIPHQKIGVRTRDCAPIIIYSQSMNWACAIHAGWRGLCGGIIEQVKHIAPHRDLVAFVGHCVKDCHYEIGQEVHDHILQAQPKHRDAMKYQADKIHFNLSAACSITLRNIGIQTISTATCNACHGLPSHRHGHEEEYLYTCVQIVR